MCCGNKRKQLIKEQQHSNMPVADNTPARMWDDVPFQYSGQSAIMVTGLVTGKRYRFNQYGDVEIVDYRDASSMMGINALQKVSSK